MARLLWRLGICLASFVFVINDAAAQQAAAQTPQQPVLQMPRVRKLPQPRQMHGSAVIGNRLFVFGGNTNPGGPVEAWSNEVLSAEIQADGNLGPWRQERPMPEYRSYLGNAVEVINDRIYIIGGTVADSPTVPENQTHNAQDVLWTSFQADGSLAPWRKSRPFPGKPVSCLATASGDNNLYIVAGSSVTRDAPSVITDEVIVATIAPDGTPGNWRVGSKLPFPLWFHGAAIQEDRLYVWGGLNKVASTSANAKLISAQINRNGEIGQWRDENQPMPYPVYSATYCGFNDFLVATCGRYAGGHPTNVVWFNHLVKGAPGVWSYVMTDLDTRVYHALGLDKARGWIYITGGQSKLTRGAPVSLIDTVQLYSLKQPIQMRLDTVKTGTASATPTPAPTRTDAAKTELIFFKMDDATRLAQQANRNVLIFFYAPEVPTCRRFYDTVMQSAEFKEFASGFVLSAVDTSKPESQPLLSKYVIFKVPSLVEARPDGTIVRSTFRMRTAEDFRDFASGK